MIIDITKAKCNLFATKDNTTNAIEFAHGMFKPEDKANLTIAIMIYHNTLVEQLQKLINQEIEDMFND